MAQGGLSAPEHLKMGEGDAALSLGNMQLPCLASCPRGLIQHHGPSKSHARRALVPKGSGPRGRHARHLRGPTPSSLPPGPLPACCQPPQSSWPLLRPAPQGKTGWQPPNAQWSIPLGGLHRCWEAGKGGAYKTRCTHPRISSIQGAL